MPKNNRFADTVQFIRNLTGANNVPVLGASTVADLLDGYIGAIPPQVDLAMSQGRSGTELSRKYRRAMILILCVLNNTSTRDAKDAVGMISDAGLHAAAAQMIKDVLTIYGGRVLNPVANQLVGNPLAFLTANRIKLGRGAMVASGASQYDLSWDPHGRFYKLEPSDPMHNYVHAKINGFNIYVQNYSTVKDGLHDITGDLVAGDLAVTTQLSGCTVIYKVNGPNLTVAHIMPGAGVRQLVPQDLAQYAGSPLGVIQTMRMIRDGNLGRCNGTLGIYGMVSGPNETGLRMLGARRVRTHGYTDQLGNAYFIGVKVGGNWQLFGQQNNPGVPNGGVSNIMQLYP